MMVKESMPANVAAEPAYWTCETNVENVPVLKRACKWDKSVDWLPQYLPVNSIVSHLNSPRLIAPEIKVQEMNCWLVIPKDNWRSVPAESFCERWTVSQIDRIMLDIVRAVELLNNSDIIIFNLCPSNVLINDSEGEPRAALSDFSSCQHRLLPEKKRIAFLNMLEYASPEVLDITAKKPPLAADFHTDVFSLGLLYHKYLTGKLPKFDMVRDGDLNSPVSIGKVKLSRKLDQPHRNLIERMLHLDPAGRIPSAFAVAREIEQIMQCGNCRIELSWPGHEGEILTLLAPNAYNSWQRIPQGGTATFGPLLSSIPYDLRWNGKSIATIAFPSPGSEQKLTLDISKLFPHESSGKPRSRNTRLILLDPPVNHISRIEILSERYCQLTLINSGTFRIRTRDVARFGIEHILESTGR